SQCFEREIEFHAEIRYERNLDLIVDGQQKLIDRLFLRQSHFEYQTYYTLQLTCYNKGSWHGSYTSIYPNDLGRLEDLQLIMDCKIANQLNESHSMELEPPRKRKRMEL